MYIERESSELTVSWCAISGLKQDLFHAPIWFPWNFYQSSPNTNSKQHALNTNFIIILEICQTQPFHNIEITLRETFGLCCVHIAQLMTHLAVYTLLFTLHLCYKPLYILQRVTKSHNVHISRHHLYHN